MVFGYRHCKRGYDVMSDCPHDIYLIHLLQELILDMFFDLFNIKPPEWHQAFIDGRRLTSELIYHTLTVVLRVSQCMVRRSQNMTQRLRNHHQNKMHSN